MSLTFRQPSTNSDKIGPGGIIIAGTSDSVITLPTASGEIALKSDISQTSNTTTTYVLQNTYTDATTDDPQTITEWDIPVVAGKVYKFEYFLFGRAETGGAFSNQFAIYYQTSSFTNPLAFAFTGGFGNYSSPDAPSDLSTATNGITISNNDFIGFETLSGTFLASETGTLRHLVQNVSPYTGPQSSSFIAGESFLQVTPLN